MTTNDFIEKNKIIHNNEYDYSKVEYVNARTKVCIICPIHGEFWQLPTSHLRGQGCPKCGKLKQQKKQTLTTEEFIERARKIHGNKYDYSKAEYVNTKTKICIICPTHGEFWQTPSNHLCGKGCDKCAHSELWNKRERRTTEKFIKEAREIHGDKYDYSKVEYINSQTKICIICPKHGEFWQTPNSHLQGQGCEKCGIIARGIKKRMTVDKWKEKCKKIHNNRYNYDKVNFDSFHDYVTIICPIHGEFKQKAERHLRGNNCPKCHPNARRTTEDFITKARVIHGDKYDYSKVEYVNNATKVCIICPKHGEFWQTPNTHLANKGCPHCSTSKLEEIVKNLLDENKIQYDDKKRWKWLKSDTTNWALKPDVFIPSKNLVIECQGIQHIRDIEHFGTIPFDIRLKYDRLKANLCADHNIKVMYVVPHYYYKQFISFGFIYNKENTIDEREIYKILNL